MVQVNEKVLWIKKGHIGIVEKEQETSLGTGMHNRAILCSMNYGCVLESRVSDTPTSHCVTW